MKQVLNKKDAEVDYFSKLCEELVNLEKELVD